MKHRRYVSITRVPHQGFTLLELLLTVAILALMVGIIGGVFRLSIRSWEKGEEAVDKFRRIRIVTDMIAQQVKSLYPYWYKQDNAWKLLMKGESKTLTFVSPLSLTSPLTSGLVGVQYALDENSSSDTGSRFIVRESMMTNKDSLEELPQRLAGEGTDIALLSELDDVTFDYYVISPDSGEGEWKPSWDSEIEEEIKLPSAIRIRFSHKGPETDEGEKMTTAMTIPLMVAPLDTTAGVLGSAGSGPPASPFAVLPKPGQPPIPVKTSPGDGKGTIATPFGDLPLPPGGGKQSGGSLFPFGDVPSSSGSSGGGALSTPFGP